MARTGASRLAIQAMNAGRFKVLDHTGVLASASLARGRASALNTAAASEVWKNGKCVVMHPCQSWHGSCSQQDRLTAAT